MAERGFDPVVAPMLAVRPGAVRTRLAFDAILLTSRNAVPSVPAWYRTVPVLAVGSATAERARAAGFATVLDADGDAAALADLAKCACAPGARLLFVHARGQGDVLAASLAAAGFRVQRRRGYAVASVRKFPAAAAAALQAGGVRAAMFLSAETARAFVRLIPRTLRPSVTEVDAVAIGEAAANALGPLPWRRVRVSIRPTLDHVLALL